MPGRTLPNRDPARPAIPLTLALRQVPCGTTVLVSGSLEASVSYRRSLSFVALAAVASIGLAACGDDGTSDSSSTTPSADSVCSTADTSGNDLLAEVCNNGTIVVSTDPKYPPQSSLTPRTG